MKKYQLFLFLFLTTTACQRNHVNIQGTASSLTDGDTIFITADLETGLPMDTIIVYNGRFDYQTTADSTRLCLLYSAAMNHINQPFFLEPGTITINLSEIPGLSRVSGTLVNDRWQQLNDSVIAYGRQINQLAEQLFIAENIDSTSQAALQDRMEQTESQFAQCVINTAKQNINNELGYFILTNYGPDVIDDANRISLIKQLPTTIRNRQLIREIETVLGGESSDLIPDFSMSDPKGQLISILNEAKKHKLTILDFWASWCQPCMSEMHNLTDLYKDYSSRGLEIIGISLDTDPEAWRAAIKIMNLSWIQLSDLKGWDNKAALLFGVRSIPFTMAVDTEGKILASGLRGESLRQFVKSQLE